MKNDQITLAAALHTCFYANPASRARLVAAKILPPALITRFLAGAADLSDAQVVDVRLWMAQHHPNVLQMMDDASNRAKLDEMAATVGLPPAPPARDDLVDCPDPECPAPGECGFCQGQGLTLRWMADEWRARRNGPAADPEQLAGAPAVDEERGE